VICVDQKFQKGFNLFVNQQFSITKNKVTVAIHIYNSFVQFSCHDYTIKLSKLLVSTKLSKPLIRWLLTCEFKHIQTTWLHTSYSKKWSFYPLVLCTRSRPCFRIHLSFFGKSLLLLYRSHTASSVRQGYIYIKFKFSVFAYGLIS